MKAGEQLHTFTILEVLGHGGMGGVFVGQNSENAELVAIKTLFEEFSKDEAYVRRFQREASVYRKLNHPNIVRCIASGFDRGVYFIAMEHIKGKSLDVILKENGALGVEHSLKIAEALSSAVYHAHSRGVIHRDIKPQNIMINEQGVVKLLDFGVAQADDDLVKTASGSIVGTFFYSSPEQNQGQKIDERSDLYSLGLVFYELLVGHRALNGATLLEVSSLQLQGRIRPPGSFDPSIPPSVEKLVLKLIERDPNQRYQSARDVQADIRAQLDGHHHRVGPVANTRERELAAKWSQAKEAFARRDLDRALELAIEVSRGQTGTAELHCLLGKIYAAKDYTYNAIEEFKKTLALEPGNCQYKLDFAVALYSMKMSDRAQEEFEKVLEIDPNNPFAKQYLQLIAETSQMVETSSGTRLPSSSARPLVEVPTAPQQEQTSFAVGFVPSGVSNDVPRFEGLFIPPPSTPAVPSPVAPQAPWGSNEVAPPTINADYIPPPGMYAPSLQEVPPPGQTASPHLGAFIPPPGSLSPPRLTAARHVDEPKPFDGGVARVAAYVPPPRRTGVSAEPEPPQFTGEAVRDDILGRARHHRSSEPEYTDADALGVEALAGRRFKSKVRGKKSEELDEVRPPLDPGRARNITLLWWGGGYLYLGNYTSAIVFTFIQAVVLAGVLVVASAWALPDGGLLGDATFDLAMLSERLADVEHDIVRQYFVRPLQHLARSEVNDFLKAYSKEAVVIVFGLYYLWAMVSLPGNVHRYAVLSNLTGKVVEVRRDLSVKINLGEERGVHIGQIFSIQKKKHMDELHALNFRTMMAAPRLFTIGEAKVVSTTLHFAICKFRRLSGETSNPSIGDRVILRKRKT